MNLSILTLLISQMLIYSAPLIFTSLGGVFSERSGIVNVGLEGIMVIGAFAGVVFNIEFAETFGKATPFLAVIVGGLAGVVFATIHAISTINFRADHVVSGTVLNLLAPALGVFLVKVFYNKGQTDSIRESFGKFSFPVLADIPVLIAGFLGGVGGAVSAQSVNINFSATTIIGSGFIALAAVIFGKWNPIGAMLASLFFGLSQSLAVIGSQLPGLKDIPSVYLQIAPYLITVIALSAFFGQSVAPKADGVNYIKSK